MTKERLIHLKENCSLVSPNMKELKELYEYILNKELPGSEGPWTATQKIILQYVDEHISKLEGECMDKGFTIKCNECGLQVIYNQHGNLLAKDNDDITMHSWGYTHETRVGIYCECGNKIGYIEEDESECYIHPYADKSNAERGR